MIRRIYYLEDNEKMGKMLKRSLSRIGEVCPVEVTVYTNTADFMNAMKEAKPSIILIDLMLPNGEDGYDVLKTLKATRDYSEIPVVIVSAKVGDYERYMCLEAGAHAYFTKPFFSLSELNSSIKNFMRIPKDDTIVVCGDVVLDSSIPMVTIAGEKVNIVHKEFELLKLLAKNPNTLITKEQIYQSVWKEKFPEGSRTLDQYIKVLRKKAFPNNPEVIETHRRLGYKFVYDTEK